MQEENDQFYSLAEAAKYSRVCRQAVFLAIQKKQLKAEKRMMVGAGGKRRLQWVINRKDLDAYRSSKYNREKRIVDGEKLFDIENDRWSVLHASKVLSEMLGRAYPAAHIYYLIRYGKLRAHKKGNAWVISRESLLNLYNQESGPDAIEMA